MRYAELQVTTNYSFLRGASHPAELMETAAELGLSAIAITDRNSLAGVVKAHIAAKAHGIKVIIGCRLDLQDGSSLLCLPTDKPAYSRLVRLLTEGKRRAPKGECHLAYPDLVKYGEGQIMIALDEVASERLRARLIDLSLDFAGRCYLGLTRRFQPNEAMRLYELEGLAASVHVPLVVTNDVLYHKAERRVLQDVLTCVQDSCTIDTLGHKRELSADCFLKPAAEMYRLFPRYEAAVARAAEIADRCTFSLDELRYQYPDEHLFPGLTSQKALEHLTEQGAARRYPDGMTDKIRAQIKHELGVIAQLNYAPYFITVWRIVEFARSRGIVCQGRGSAANSTVCYCLGVTSIDPAFTDLLFERFISVERNEPPDIDIDFEHERREEVIQWIYDTYGRDHAALTATVIHYRSRRAVREVGKALGLPEDVTGALAGSVWGWSEDGVPEQHARELGLDPNDYRLALTLKLTRTLIGFPRHLSQHPGGFVIVRDRLDELVPIENASMPDRTVVEWDKDDLEALNMMKVDVLALGMLSCMRRAFDLLAQHKDIHLEVATIPQEDPLVYDMLCQADSVGVFQVESRAQMNMLPRLKPRRFYDLVIEVAIVRPGPIQGDMVHPYLRRRDKREPVVYPSKALAAVLEKTLGVPLFQEQAMRIAIVGAGFSPGEADQLRRAMATFRNLGTIHKFERRFIEGMVGNGYERPFAERCFQQIKGFGTYGFPESHSASFSILVYASSWIKCHHPDVFLCAILNSQPMGFYAPAQLIRDAKNHGVTVLPVDINASHWDCLLERCGEVFAVRIGFRYVKGMTDETVARIVAGRYEPYTSIDDVRWRTSANVGQLELLADADGFAALGIDRHKASWTIKGLRTDQLPLFAAADAREATFRPELNETDVNLPVLSEGAEVLQDYLTLSFTLRHHPISFVRSLLAQAQWQPLAKVATAKNGQRVKIAGVVLVRQRPGSAKGVTFITLEDETANANLVVWPTLFEQFRWIIMSSGVLGCVGHVQTEGNVIHVVVERLEDLTPLVRTIGQPEQPLASMVARGDEATKGGGDPRQKEKSGALNDGSAHSSPMWKHPRTLNVIADTIKSEGLKHHNLPLKSRNFH